MALAHVTDDKYWNFYKDRNKEQTLILDNGSYEGRLDTEAFEERIADYQPEVIVLPDLHLGNWERNLHLSLGYLELCKASFGEFMFVPQAEPGDMDGFIKGLHLALKDKRLAWIGIPRCLATDIARNNLARCYVADFIKGERPDVRIHALGMVDGNPYELCYLAERGVYSCDSSAPVWRGWNTARLEDPWNGPDIDFNANTPEEFECIESNLTEVDRACRHGIRLRSRDGDQQAEVPGDTDSTAEPHFD